MNLSLTTACNRRCAYCFQKGWYLTKEAIEMPLDDAKEIVRRFAKDGVSLLGGEPLLYSRLPELLEFLKTEGKSVMLITNASTDNFKEIEPFIGSPITGFLLNSDYPKVQRAIFLENFRWLASRLNSVCLSTTLLDNRDEQMVALNRCIELREIWKEIKRSYQGLAFRISPYSPNPTGTFEVHNFDADLFFFLGNLRVTADVRIHFDCMPNGCEISLNIQRYMMSRGIEFPIFCFFYSSCPLDFLVDGSVIYCSSSPQINVESWREFNTQKELIAALGAKRVEYLKSQIGCSPACPDYERCYRPCVSKIKFYPNKVKKVDDSP